jgi:hypothetical protein
VGLSKRFLASWDKILDGQASGLAGLLVLGENGFEIEDLGERVSLPLALDEDAGPNLERGCHDK